MAVTTYNIEFKDAKDRIVVILISKVGESGDTQTLPAGASPLVISENDESDPMIPIRATNAQISVVCTNTQMIRIENNLQWSVTIRRAGILMWAGYLRAELQQMAYSPIESEITYIADDVLGVLKYVKTNRTLEKSTLMSLLTNTYTLLDNSIPVPAIGNAPVDALNLLSVYAQNWLNQEENDEGVLTNVQDSHDVSEEDIIAFLGVCARYWQGELYLGSLFGTRFYDSGSLTEIPTIDGAQMSWTGFHSLDWEQGAGHISVESGGKHIQDSEIPALDNADYMVINYGYVMPQTQHQTNQYNCFARILAPRENSGMTVWQDTSYTAGNFWGKIGAHPIDVDQWNAADDANKTNFAFRRMLALACTGVGTDGTSHQMPSFQVSDYTSADDVYNRALAAMMAGLTTAMVTFTSPASLYVRGGGFTMDFVCEMSNFSMLQGIYRKVTFISGTASILLVCRLQFADQYWNGSTWQASECKFLAPTNKKTINMMFNGDGSAMPLNGLNAGIVKLEIFGGYSAILSDEDEGGVIRYTCAWVPDDLDILSKLELKYNPPLNFIEQYLEDTAKINQNTDKFPSDNEKNVRLNLCSNVGIKENWGQVYIGQTELTALHWPKLRQTWAPERLVLKKNTLALARNRQYAILSAEAEYSHMPFRRILLNGRTWYPLSVKTDMQTCFSEIKLFDITDIMAELPAVGTDEESAGTDIEIFVFSDGVQVFLTLNDGLDFDTNIIWSTASNSGEVVIPSGETSIMFVPGDIIHDQRDIGFAASPSTGEYTYYFTWIT